MTRLLLLAISATSLVLTSCETTGDPSQGGLFGWSQNKADQRIDERQQRLQQLQQDNAYQAGRSSALEQTKSQLQNQ